MKLLQLCLAGLLTLCALPSANADIQISFVESAPKDSFLITNNGDCNLSNLGVEIDLSSSVGQLLFDTTAMGAGVEVYQPFEAGDGNPDLSSSATVGDGDQRLSVMVDALAPDAVASFTIDVDDTLAQSALGQIRVTGSEIEGAQVRLSVGTQDKVSAEFSESSVATLVLPSCG